MVDGKSDGSLLDLETQSGTKQMEKNATTMTPSKWAQPSEKKPSRLIEEITAEPAAEGDKARRPLIEDITAEPRGIKSSKQQVGIRYQFDISFAACLWLKASDQLLALNRLLI